MRRVPEWAIRERDFPETGTRGEQIEFLLRYAILAPSSHNTQPWCFQIEEGGVRLLADKRRWLRVADADQRELFVSVGCALENLLIASAHFGFESGVTYFPNGEDDEVAAVAKFQRSGRVAPYAPGLFEAIVNRHTNHREYDGKPLARAMRERLEAVAGDGIAVHLTEDEAVRRQVDGLVVRADAVQFADPAWREELGFWLGQGVFGTGWLMSKMSQLAVTYLNMGRATAKKDSQLLGSAAALGVITARMPDRTGQVKVGQVFERLFLTATALGLQLQPMNQVLQVPEIKAEFSRLLPAAWGEPQITFRIGHAEPEEHTPRRALGEVLR